MSAAVTSVESPIWRVQYRKPIASFRIAFFQPHDFESQSLIIPYTNACFMHNQPSSRQSLSVVRMGREKKRITHYEIISAFVGAFAVIVLSPISLSISQYFSRSILSIEYVEYFIEESRQPISAEMASALTLSQGFRQQEMSSPEFGQIERILGTAKDLSRSESLSLRHDLEQLHLTLVAREEELVRIGKKIDGAHTEGEMRALNSEFLGVPADLATNFNSAELKAKVDEELRNFSETISATEDLSAAVGSSFTGPTKQLRFKLSVLNRGNTDGLVRNVGALFFEGFPAEFTIVRAQPDRESVPLTLNAVPVAVVNPTDTSEERGSVGKVEKNSMSEFWFRVDLQGLSADQQRLLESILSRTAIPRFRIALFDQNRRAIFSLWNSNQK